MPGGLVRTVLCVAGPAFAMAQSLQPPIQPRWPLGTVVFSRRHRCAGSGIPPKAPVLTRIRAVDVSRFGRQGRGRWRDQRAVAGASRITYILGAISGLQLWPCTYDAVHYTRRRCQAAAVNAAMTRCTR